MATLRRTRLQKGLNFEREAEGPFITAQWYRTQIAHLGLVRTVSESVTNLTGLLKAVFVAEVEGLIRKDRLVFAATLIQRGLEACHKFPLHFNDIKGHLERLSVHRRVPDIPCPEIPWEDLMRRITAVRERLLVLFGQLAPKLADLPANHTLPDYFGQACLVLANECYDAMVAGNKRLFEQLFPLVFPACLRAHDRLQGQMKERSSRTPRTPQVAHRKTVEKFNFLPRRRRGISGSKQTSRRLSSGSVRSIMVLSPPHKNKKPGQE